MRALEWGEYLSVIVRAADSGNNGQHSRGTPCILPCATGCFSQWLRRGRMRQLRGGRVCKCPMTMSRLSCGSPACSSCVLCVLVVRIAMIGHGHGNCSTLFGPVLLTAHVVSLRFVRGCLASASVRSFEVILHTYTYTASPDIYTYTYTRRTATKPEVVLQAPWGSVK